MGKRRSCTPELRQLIINKYAQPNSSMAKVASDLGCSKKMVFTAIKTYTDTGSCNNKIKKNGAAKQQKGKIG